MDVNSVFFAGRLTRDPSLRYLPSQSCLTEFGVVANRKYKDANGAEHDEATFLDCVAYGKQAELINKHFQKGKEIFLIGRIKYDAWEDKTTKQRRSKVMLAVEKFQFVGGRGEGQGKPAQSAPQDGKPAEEQFDEADIPF
jgi:single-strand DNA-binding protein